MVAGVAELAASSTPTRLAGTWRPCRRGRCFAGNSYSSKIPAQGCVPKRGGTPGAGIQDAGNGDSGVLESEIHELRIQGAGTRDSVGIMASRPHGTRIQGCRNRELRAAWDLDSRMPKTVTLKAEILAHWEPGFRGGVEPWLHGNLRDPWLQEYRPGLTPAFATLAGIRSAVWHS